MQKKRTAAVGQRGQWTFLSSLWLWHFVASPSTQFVKLIRSLMVRKTKSRPNSEHCSMYQLQEEERQTEGREEDRGRQMDKQLQAAKTKRLLLHGGWTSAFRTERDTCLLTQRRKRKRIRYISRSENKMNDSERCVLKSAEEAEAELF